MLLVRLQKVMAQAGVASRRKAEHLISEGRVRVNGHVVTQPGVKVNPDTDKIEVDGRLLKKEPYVYVMLNKPTGVVTTVRDPQSRPTVVDLVPQKARLFPVGRLDVDTEGLLVLTNDGELTYRLTHPSYEIEKVYVATVKGHVTSDALEQLRNGVMLDDGMTWPAKAKILRHNDQANNQTSVISLAIHEGRNRQVRRMADAVGHPVLQLRRVGFGPLQIGNLSSGSWRHLQREEVDALYRSVGLSTGG